MYNDDMSIWNQFCEIFTQMSWIPAVLLGVGLIFVIIEVFVPGFGFFGITGTLTMVAGIIVRIAVKPGLNVTQSIMMILLVIAVFAVCAIIMVHSAKHGFLGKTGLFETKSTLSKDYGEVEKNLRKLIGKSGKTVSPLKLGGKAKIKGKIYDVLSINSYIDAGVNIKVVEIKNNTIMVRKWFE